MFMFYIMKIKKDLQLQGNFILYNMLSILLNLKSYFKEVSTYLLT